MHWDIIGILATDVLGYSLLKSNFNTNNYNFNLGVYFQSLVIFCIKIRPYLSNRSPVEDCHRSSDFGFALAFIANSGAREDVGCDCVR